MADSFGKTIRSARQAKGLTQKDLAAAISKANGAAISPQFMNDMELERRYPSPLILDRIANALELDPLYLRVLAGQPASDRPASEYPPERVQRAIRAYRRALGEAASTRPRSSARRRAR
jgi:transcriptional regulator with XRE-family HTH domain